MFTDMVDFTALMQTDEQQAREKQVRHKEVFDACVRDFLLLVCVRTNQTCVTETCSGLCGHKPRVNEFHSKFVVASANPLQI